MKRTKRLVFIVGRAVVAASLLVVAAGALSPATSRAGGGTGEAVFRGHCVNCHSLTAGQSSAAPDLTGVVGRKAGSLADYQYTAALRDANFVWTPEKLIDWLKSPHNVVPETEMTFPGLKSEKERAEVVEFLKARRAK